jgi:hypothetical protein
LEPICYREGVWERAEKGEVDSVNAKAKPRRGRAQQVARAGEFFVAAELSRRGAHAAVYVGNMPRIDLVASSVDQIRTASIQVKTRTAGSWHARTTDGRPSKKKRGETHFWIFVDIFNNKAKPDFYIMPEWWIANDIHERHAAYLKRYGGKRKHGGDSTHHSINLDRIAQWKDRWDILGLDLIDVE